MLAVGGLLTPVAVAGSLYDTAPPIGLPSSHAVQYSAYLNVGWDSNTSCRPDGDSSAYTGFGVRATYAEYESVNKAAYNANIGGYYYFDGAYDSNQKLFADIDLSGRFIRDLGSGSTLTLSGNVGYKADPNYANGISSSRAQGDVFLWSLNAAYSRPVDARWSWNLSVNSSGYYYSEEQYNIDDRYYVGASTGMSYKYTERTTFSGNFSWRFDGRSEGEDANNIYAGLTVAHSIDAISSISLSANAQFKTIDGGTNVYPNLRIGYNRRMADVLNLSFYLSLDNENINTYLGQGAMYRSSMTWRSGVMLTYNLTPQIALFGGAELYFSDYSKGTNGLEDSNQKTYSVNCGISYAITKSLAWTTTYKYTQGNEDAGDYTRNIVQSGLTYSF